MFHNRKTGGGAKWWEFLLDTKKSTENCLAINKNTSEVERKGLSELPSPEQTIFIKYTFTIQNYT